MTTSLPTHRLALRLARFHRACWWLHLGVHLVPLKPRSKHIQPGYGPHRARITDPAFARKWFLNTDANIAVVLGDSSALLVADWDDQLAYHRWRATLGAAVSTLAETSPRGYHLFFTANQLPSAVGNGCELKTSGVCTVFPSVYPSGKLYRLLHPAPILPLTLSRAHALFPFLSDQSRTIPPPDSQQRFSPGVGILARIKAARPTLHEMIAAGIVLSPGGANTLVGRCPFHDDHSPSLWLYTDSGLWGCNRPDCLASGTHDVINFRAFSRRISNRAAIRQLAVEFL